MSVLTPCAEAEIAAFFAHVAAEAGKPVMEVYASDFSPDQKADKSPVTEADKRAEEVIVERLMREMPHVPIIAEERWSDGVRPEGGRRFILVDPVDGTKEFINKNGEFTVNIALVEDGVPVAGAVYAPALGRMFFGAEAGGAADAPTRAGAAFAPGEARAIRARPADAGRLVAVMSRSHADERTRAFAVAEGVTETVSAGSSLKFCLLAEGVADLYPRFAPTMEWDTAAGHAVLAGAGGRVATPEGGPFRYGKPEYRNGFFIARGRGDA